MRDSIDADRAFMKRTLSVLRNYGGRHESTNVINCLLGMLIVPGDEMFTGIPDEPVSALRGWGISPASIRRRYNGSGWGGLAEPTLRDVVEGLRRAAASFNLRPRFVKGRFAGFEFRDDGLQVSLTTAQARTFVEKLAHHVAVQGHFGPYGAVVGARYIASWQREPFHRPECNRVRRIERRNLQGVRTREAAIEAGHRPCRVCRP